MNSVAYDEKLDQIVLSVRGFNEIWVIDHSTTTAEARTHSGGRQGMGGLAQLRDVLPLADFLGDGGVAEQTPAGTAGGATRAPPRGSAPSRR